MSGTRRPSVALLELDELNALAEPEPPPELPGAVARLRRYLDAAEELAESRWGAGAGQRHPEIVVQLAAILAADINTPSEK